MSTDEMASAVPGAFRLFPFACAAREEEERRTRALVAAAQQGSREAFERLLRENERAVYRMTLAALGRRQDAEDAAQETFVLAWRKLATFRGESSFRTWLLAIA
jgi:DNA-directed RNA polymerase specialized sigma24 family protein